MKQILATRRCRLICAAMVTCASLTIALPSATPSVARAAPVGAPVVSLVGDSTLAGLATTGSNGRDVRTAISDSYQLTFDAESCRRLVMYSCRGRAGYHPVSLLPLIQSTLRGRLGEVMVIMDGYDDATIGAGAEQIVTEALAQGVGRILWLNYRTSISYVLPGGLAARTLYGQHNASLADLAARHPNVQILDWDGYSLGRTTWFASDGIHVTPAGAEALAGFIKVALDDLPALHRCRDAQSSPGNIVVGSQQSSSTAPAPGLGFVALSPRRVLDTRVASPGDASKNLAIGGTVAIDLNGIVPGDAAAVALSVTAVDTCGAGYLTVFDCLARPPTSNVNYGDGRTTAGMAISSISNGRVCIYTSARTDLVVDVIGAFNATGDPFHPMTPTRWVDTRGAPVQLPDVTGVRAAASDARLMVRGQGGIPPTATAVWLNLTVAEPTMSTVLEAYPGPCGAPPLASAVNARARHSVASAVLVAVGADGSICVRTYSGSSHVVVDVAGWFGPGTGGLRYSAQPPVRLLDTRLGGGALSSSDRVVRVGAVSVLTVTAVASASDGFVSVTPCGTAPVSSLINTATSEDAANVIAVGPDAQGSVCVHPSTPSHIVVDQVATFVP